MQSPNVWSVNNHGVARVHYQGRGCVQTNVDLNTVWHRRLIACFLETGQSYGTRYHMCITGIPALAGVEEGPRYHSAPVDVQWATLLPVLVSSDNEPAVLIFMGYSGFGIWFARPRIMNTTNRRGSKSQLYSRLSGFYMNCQLTSVVLVVCLLFEEVDSYSSTYSRSDVVPNIVYTCIKLGIDQTLLIIPNMPLNLSSILSIAPLFCPLLCALLSIITLRIICHLAAVVMIRSGPSRR